VNGDVLTMNNSIDQQFVEFVVKSLVSKPDAVIVERTIDEKGVLLLLTVDPEDLGRVIGKRGATAQSIRTLLRALGTKNDARYNLKIVDNGVPQDRSGSSGGGTWGDDDAPAAPKDEESSSKAKDKPAPEPLDDEDEEESTDSVVSKTRAELAEMDDLDV